MAEIGEAVLESLDGLAGAGGEPVSGIDSYRGRTARMRAVEREYGGEREAARAVGVQLRTWRAWQRKGARLAAGSVRKLSGAAGAVYRAARLRALDRYLRNVRSSPRVCARIRWIDSPKRAYMPKDNGWRCTNLDSLTGTDMRDLIPHWVAGDAPAAGEAFQRLTSAAYGRNWARPGDRILFEGDNCSVTW